MEDLSKFGKYLADIKKDIENGMEAIEKGKKSREQKRKEFFATEVKQLLAVMAKNDANIVRDLKGEAFDMLQSINKICDEASLMGMGRNVNIDSLKEKFESLGVGEFLRGLNVTVSSNTDLLTSTIDRLSDAVFLNSPILNPRQIFLQLPEQQAQSGNDNRKHVTINIFTATDAIKLSPLVMRNLYVEVEGCSPSLGKEMLEEVTVLSKIKSMKGSISEDGDYMTIQLKKTKRWSCENLCESVGK